MNISFELPDGDYFIELPEYMGYRFAISANKRVKYPYTLVAYKKPITVDDATLVVFECEARTLYDLRSLLTKGMRQYANK